MEINATNLNEEYNAELSPRRINHITAGSRRFGADSER